VSDPDPVPSSRAFREAFRLKDLRRAYEDAIALRGSAGLDRVSPTRFHVDHDAEIRTIYRKVRNGTYRFTPYLQGLIPKGRGKPPRVISLPTVRDRIVLRQLKEALHRVFPERVGRRLPNAHVREVAKFLSSQGKGLVVCRADIRGFYDSLHHPQLEEALRSRMGSKVFRTLIFRAIRTPTVPATYRREQKDRFIVNRGVPQGLSISTILANVYLGDLDQQLAQHVPSYHRYVDDILIMGSEPDVKDAKHALGARLEGLRLELNTEKGGTEPSSVPFDFLGYRLADTSITVRPRNVDRILGSIAAAFTHLREAWEERRKERHWLTESVQKRIFVEELNLKITGAVCENRRYGWLFYFLEMNDQTLLHQMDAVVESFYRRSPLFHGIPADAKRFARAYFEARHRPRAGYVLDYDALDTLHLRERYLRRFGILEPKRMYNAQEIHELFEKDRDRRLAWLEADVGFMS